MGQPETDQQERPRGAADKATSEGTSTRILFTVDGHQPGKVLPLVCDFVAEADAELLVGSPVILPDQTPLTAPEPRVGGERLAAQYVLEVKQQCADSRSVDPVVTTGRSRDSIVNTMIGRYEVSTFITEDYPKGGIRSLLGFEAIDEVAVPEFCDTLIVTRIEHSEAIESILVPIARGPHSELAIETGLALAHQNEAKLELLHVYTEDDHEGLANGKQVLEIGSDRLHGYEPADQTLLEADDIPGTIIDHAQPFDITVFGAPREGKLRQYMLGTIPEAVSEEADGTVLIAHKGGADETWIDKWI